MYTYNVPGTREKSRGQLFRDRLVSGEEDLQDLGNDIRRYFEELLHEFSKIVHVGGKNECGHILDRLENGKNLYLYEDKGHHFKTADDMLDSLSSTMKIKRADVMISQLKEKYAKYKANDYYKKTVLPLVQELRIYQKLSLHPLSHAHLHGTPTYTEKELNMTVTLIEKLEGVVNELIGFDVSTV